MKIMKSFVLPLIVSLAILVSAAYAAAGDAPRVDRTQMEKVEKSLDATLLRFTTDNSHTLIGLTRGVYLEGVGAVLTAEVILINAPINIMHPVPTKEEIAMMRKKKIERLPILKRVLKDALVSAAASLETIPPDEQVVIAVIVPRFTVEDAAGLPVQVTVQAPKRKLLELKGAALDSVIRVTEN
ncbi:MAG: hypothetical protein JWO19_1788 [Bryobacterales bacterium]|jgi:hypothetical protein|nr:hypothetical protein [Bryobacterales bacterium]